MSADRTAYLLLDVAGTPCALPHAAAAEVLPLPDLHAPPASGGWLVGLLNLGGVPVPVIDLAPLLGLRPGASPPELYAHLVLAHDRALAYRVDRVADLVRVPEGAVRPADAAASLNGCVAAELTLEGRLVHVLDPARLLTVQESARAEAFARAAADRLAQAPALSSPSSTPRPA